MRHKPLRVLLTLEVEVFDEELLAHYASENHERWGMDLPPDCADAVYESLVLNDPEGGPLAIGLEIVNHEARELPRELNHRRA